MSSEKTLNPCPLCGKKIVLNRLQNGFSVEHAEKTDCELRRATIYADNYERATELWNGAKVSNGTRLDALNKLKELRKEKGFTLRALAYAVGMLPTSLCRFEQGLRILSPEDLGAICDALGLSGGEKNDILSAFEYVKIESIAPHDDFLFRICEDAGFVFAPEKPK